MSEISEKAIMDALPQLEAQRRKGLRNAGLVVLGGIVGAFVVYQVFGSAFGAIFPIVFGLFGVPIVAAMVRHKQEATLLPIIAKGFGLAHQKGDKTALAIMPKGLVPEGDSQSVDDVLSGSIAGSPFTFAEYRTSRTSQHSTGSADDNRTETETTTLFYGVVVILQSQEKVPDFILRNQVVLPKLLGFLKKFVETSGGDGFEKLKEIAGPDGGVFGLWMRPQDAGRAEQVAAFASQLMRKPLGADDKVELEAAAAVQGKYVLALNRPADMLKVGGLFSGKDKVLTQIRKVAEEMAIPVRLVTDVLEIEKAALSRA